MAAQESITTSLGGDDGDAAAAARYPHGRATLSIDDPCLMVAEVKTRINFRRGGDPSISHATLGTTPSCHMVFHPLNIV